MSGQSRAWVRALIDYGALLAFFAVYVFERLHHNTDALLAATPTLMIASVLAVGLGWVLEKRLAPMPAISGAFAVIFGGMALVFHDKSILKMKPTFVYVAFAAALGVGLLFKRNPLAALMGSSVKMPDAAWRTLTFRFFLFFLASAAANELVWRTQSDDFWAGYKLAFFLVVMVFSGLQTPFLMKHMQNPDEEPPLVDPPDAGF